MSWLLKKGVQFYQKKCQRSEIQFICFSVNIEVSILLFGEYGIFRLIHQLTSYAFSYLKSIDRIFCINDIYTENPTFLLLIDWHPILNYINGWSEEYSRKNINNPGIQRIVQEKKTFNKFFYQHVQFQIVYKSILSRKVH